MMHPSRQAYVEEVEPEVSPITFELNSPTIFIWIQSRGHAGLLYLEDPSRHVEWNAS